MKIKVKEKSYREVCELSSGIRITPKKPGLFFRTLVRIVSSPELRKVGFTCQRRGMEKLGKNQPCLILMNHSSFIDLKIASALLYPRPFNIVCTYDGFVGKSWLMRNLGCIPTNKFITDLRLVRDLKYTVQELKSSVLMYPEASYSFDGTATPLPEGLGKLVKMLAIPVVVITTKGAFAHDPLYNGLQQRDVRVSAEMEYLFSPEDTKELSAERINTVLAEKFSFDNFRRQQLENIRVSEPFRADGLHRVLYKCPHCLAEGKTEGKGYTLVCHNCGKEYALDEFGYMKALTGETEFEHIPDWYAWERKCVRDEIISGKYLLHTDVEIYMLVNTDCVYHVGQGSLEHTEKGFTLTGCNGELNYFHPASASYSLYADYFWYELGDVISIGTDKVSYYCIPISKDVSVAKARLAAEEIYKLDREKKKLRV